MSEATEIESARLLIEGVRWLALATSTTGGTPSTSYLPYAPVSLGFGIVVSSLAAHWGELMARPRANVLIVGEAPDGDPFAAPRLSADVVAHEHERGSQAQEIWDALSRRHGETVRILRALPDFCPFVLVPVRARLILGFARASTLDGEALAPLFGPVNPR